MLGLKGIKALQRTLKISERALAGHAGVSRPTLRSVLFADRNITVGSIEKITAALGRIPFLLLVPKTEVASDDSVPVVSLLISRGEDWQVHFFNFVDVFRAHPDPRLVLLPPVRETPLRYKALLASTVAQLCQESGVEIPAWARKMCFLPEPWFLSGVESLKATAVQESPLFYRRNNIFVLENFLSRA